MSATVKYLRKKEWSMGNGQCPECEGVPATWFGQPAHLTPETIGHRADCKLAAALVEAGETPLMLGDFKSDVEWEMFIDDRGIFGTRHKTPEGCPRYKAWAEPGVKAFHAMSKQIAGLLFSGEVTVHKIGK
jgi:hypothetical protein